jgi:SAM-dependent methyltransferase
VRPDYAEQYKTLWERHWWWRSREAWLLSWIERLHRRAPRRRILDVGCGDGLFFERLERFGEVEGLEPDARLVVNPRWRSRIQVAPIDAGFMPARPFDLVLMLDVLEHIADDRGALRGAFRALRPGGHLLLTVPALSWLWSRHDEANAHHRRYGRGALRRILVEAGFVVETVRFFFVWTVAPMALRRVFAPAGAGVADYAVTIPPSPINRALTAFSHLEHTISHYLSWPLGSSLLAIARKADVGCVKRTHPASYQKRWVRFTHPTGGPHVTDDAGPSLRRIEPAPRAVGGGAALR